MDILLKLHRVDFKTPRLPMYNYSHSPNIHPSDAIIAPELIISLISS
jgi:hypothetical protein